VDSLGFQILTRQQQGPSKPNHSMSRTRAWPASAISIVRRKRVKITDDNTLEDINGCILCLESDVRDPNPEFPVAPRIDELVQRIEDKLRKTRTESATTGSRRRSN